MSYGYPDGKNVMTEPLCKHCGEPIRQLGETELWTHVYDMGATRIRCFAKTRAEPGPTYADMFAELQKPTQEAEGVLATLQIQMGSPERVVEQISLPLNSQGQFDFGGLPISEGRSDGPDLGPFEHGGLVPDDNRDMLARLNTDCVIAKSQYNPFFERVKLMTGFFPGRKIRANRESDEP